jgi:hypothetical protein
MAATTLIQASNLHGPSRDGPHRLQLQTFVPIRLDCPLRVGYSLSNWTGDSPEASP